MSRAPSRTNDVTVVVIFVKKLFKIFFLYGRILLPGERARVDIHRAARSLMALESSFEISQLMSNIVWMNKSFENRPRCSLCHFDRSE